MEPETRLKHWTFPRRSHPRKPWEMEDCLHLFVQCLRQATKAGAQIRGYKAGRDQRIAHRH
jgi:hypothetical protein